jgi:ATP-dependent Clp protease adaptor protein ClpS
MSRTSTKEKELVEVLDAVEITDTKDLVVFNDDINTFEHVIETLMNICHHSLEQAEQCTWIIHHKGKCTVKTGSFDELNPMRQGICEKGIDAKIL